MITIEQFVYELHDGLKWGSTQTRKIEFTHPRYILLNNSKNYHRCVLEHE